MQPAPFPLLLELDLLFHCSNVCRWSQVRRRIGGHRRVLVISSCQDWPLELKLPTLPLQTFHSLLFQHPTPFIHLHSYSGQTWQLFFFLHCLAFSPLARVAHSTWNTCTGGHYGDILVSFQGSVQTLSLWSLSWPPHLEALPLEGPRRGVQLWVVFVGHWAGRPVFLAVICVHIFLLEEGIGPFRAVCFVALGGLEGMGATSH